jgi:hypothetical protein
MAVSNTMVQTNVDTNKHEDFNLVFTKYTKERRMEHTLDKKYPLKEIAKTQNKDQ